MRPRGVSSSSSGKLQGPPLTARAPEGLDEVARLLLDALLDTPLAHAEVPQRGDGEAPELLGTLAVAEGHACGGSGEVGWGGSDGGKEAQARNTPPPPQPPGAPRR